MLEVRHLCKVYAGHRVVEGVNFSVHPGSVLAVIGPSGCGKTTLLRLIAGLERPSGGSVVLSGVVLDDMKPGERGVQFAFQAPMLYPFMSIARNLEFSRRREGGIEEAERDEICRVFQIVTLLNRRPQEISGGETQRVALARILMRRSGIALLDEPLSDVDPLLARTIRQDLVDRLRGRRAVVIYVTHDLDEAAAVADEVAVMRSGRIHQVAPSHQLYEEPGTEFVAEFVNRGRLAGFEASVVSKDGALQALVGFDGATRVEVPPGASLELVEGSQVRVLVRGGALELPGPEDVSPGPRVNGRVKRLESGFEGTECLFEAPGGCLWTVQVGSEIASDVQRTLPRVDGAAAISLSGAELFLFSERGTAIGKFKVPKRR